MRGHNYDISDSILRVKVWITWFAVYRVKDGAGNSDI